MKGRKTAPQTPTRRFLLRGSAEGDDRRPDQRVHPGGARFRSWVRSRYRRLPGSRGPNAMRGSLARSDPLIPSDETSIAERKSAVNTLPTAMLVGLLALITLLVGMLAGSINAAISRQEGDRWTVAFRHGWKGFSAALGMMLALYTAFVLPFLFLR